MYRLIGSFVAGFALCALTAVAAERSIEDAIYPGAVALGQSAEGTLGYKSFPELLPLYVFKGEPAGQSLCDRDCTAVWPIVQAQKSDQPVGEWTIVAREDGRHQWAYRGMPVYTYFEDHPNEPKGVGKRMDWYLDESADAYLSSVGVEVESQRPSRQAGKTQRIEATAALLKP